jgi:hypothetical protein
VADYLLNVLIAIDQLGTALLGGFPDETLSSYAYRMEVQRKPAGVFRRVIDALFWFQPQHCYKAYLSERNKRQMPPELR